jgi:hypothetical protein
MHSHLLKHLLAILWWHLGVIQFLESAYLTCRDGRFEKHYLGRTPPSAHQVIFLPHHLVNHSKASFADDAEDLVSVEVGHRAISVEADGFARSGGRHGGGG